MRSVTTHVAAATRTSRTVLDMKEWESLLEQLRSEFLLREEELSLLHDIDLQLLDSQRPLDRTLAFVTRRTKELLKGETAHILLRRGEYLVTAYSAREKAGADIGQRVPLATSIVGLCFTEEAPINVSDLHESAHRDRYVPIAGLQGPEMRSILCVPIRLGETVIGVISSESPRSNAFTSVHERVLSDVAAQVAIALQRAQLFNKEALMADVDRLVFENDYGSTEVLQTALERVMLELHRIESVDITGAQILFRKGSDGLEIVYSTNPSDVGLAVAIDGSISGRAVRERRTIVIGDVSQDRDYRRILGPAIKSEIAVPILVGNRNVVIGVLNVESEELNAFGGLYELVLNGFANTVRTHLAFAKLRSDVTEALELRHASDLLVAVGDQASNMVHRINNTVGAMRVEITELRDSQAQGTLTEEYLRQSLQSLLDTANRTLEIPERVARFLSKDKDRTDINGSVQIALRELGIPENIEVELSLSDDIPALELYSFDVVIQNLLQNAIDAMSNGGLLTVRTSLVSVAGVPTGYVQLSIADTGVGVPEEARSQIFELNFTTKGGKTGKGLGLGLWWVRNFVKRAKGEIVIKSDTNVGTEVIVKIPVERSTDDGLFGIR
jgi:signal transduction histidine kinase